jgi:hypothetical protein
MTVTGKMVVAKATIKPFSPTELKHAILTYKSWRLSRLCGDRHSDVTFCQEVHLAVDIHDTDQSVIYYECGDFEVLLTQDTVNDGLEALLGGDDSYVLAAYNQQSGCFGFISGLVECKINRKDDKLLNEIYRALRDAA